MPPVRLTLTVVAVGSADPFSAAVTVMLVAASPSPTELGLSERLTAVGAESLSVIVSVAVPPSGPLPCP